MNIQTLFESTIKFEMEGKNQAIHEYDKMIWNLRIGYLTIFFSAFSILLKSVIDKGSLCQKDLILDLVKILAIMISIGALFVDSNYVWRKYKVIKAINALYREIFKLAVIKEPDLKGFKNLLLISGTTDVNDQDIEKLDRLKGTGIIREFFVCLLIYLVPLIIVYFGFSLF